jgi:SNF2 family DNA or RNA helicase
MGVPEKYILAIDPKDREIIDSELKSGALEYTYYIIHWDALIRLENLVPEGRRSIEWDHLIADEIHYIKNRKVKRTTAFKRIKAKAKTGASGTPADDKPQDLWSVLNWLYPRVWSSYWRFFNNYLQWQDNNTMVNTSAGKKLVGYREVTGVKNIDKLHGRIRPYYIRRTLHDVRDDMPPKTRSSIRVELRPGQRRAYDQMVKWQTAKLGVHNSDEMETLVVEYKIATYMRLLQLTLGTCEIDWKFYNHFWDKWEGVDDEDLPTNAPQGPQIRIKEPSPKIDALFELIEDHPEEQFVVFTNFADVADIVQERCYKNGISCSKITGKVTSQVTRDAAVAKFQSGKDRIFVGTVKAAGTTITLTAAHTCIFLDKHWNPSVNEQAEDRIWRINQHMPCQIIDIIADDTVDEPRILKIWFKHTQVKQVIDVKG